MKFAACVLGSFLSLSATAASADILTETFAGTVLSGIDTRGFFGNRDARWLDL
jgi:hypothetical protein